MKFIPWYRKASKKARHNKSCERVQSWTASANTGRIMYYTTTDGTNHKVKNGWQIITDDHAKYECEQPN